MAYVSICIPSRMRQRQRQSRSRSKAQAYIVDTAPNSIDAGIRELESVSLLDNLNFEMLRKETSVQFTELRDTFS